MAIGNPSAGKSPGLDAVLTPLRKLEREAQQASKADHDAWKAKAEIAKMFEATWKTAASKAIAAGEPVPPKPAEADPGPEPFMPRFALVDATTEKTAIILARQLRGVLVARDELAGWLTSMDRYNGGGDRAFWLECYGGRAYTVERVGRDPLHIDRMTGGVMGGIQPDRLKSLLFKADDDGLLARFLPFWPNPAPIQSVEAVPEDAFIESALRRLLSLRMVTDEDGDSRPWFVPFSEKAKALHTMFRVQCREWEEGQEGLLLSFIGKLPGLVARLSLVLAYLDMATGEGDPHEIEAHHFARAAGLIDRYLLPMARRAYADGSLPKEIRAGKRLAALILEQRWQRFTSSDVLRLSRAGLLTKAELDPGLEALELGNLIRPVPGTTGAKGGRPSRSFLVNPGLWRPA